MSMDFVYIKCIALRFKILQGGEEREVEMQTRYQKFMARHKGMRDVNMKQITLGAEMF